jgi:hypothetical protein
MKRLTTISIAAALAVGTACSSNSTGSNNNGGGNADLTGTWSATAYSVTNASNQTQVYDLIGMGYSAHITFTGQTWKAVFSGPGTPSDSSSGPYTQTATTLSLTDNSGGSQSITTFTYTLSGTTLTLSNGSGSTFDFGNGEVAAILNITLKKQ